MKVRHVCTTDFCGHTCVWGTDGTGDQTKRPLMTRHFEGFDADDQPCTCPDHEDDPTTPALSGWAGAPAPGGLGF